MKKKIVTFLTAAVLLLGVLTGCQVNTKKVEVVKLDPNNPIAITVWHYYNGAQQAAILDCVFHMITSPFWLAITNQQIAWLAYTNRRGLSSPFSSFCKCANSAHTAKPHFWAKK